MCRRHGPFGLVFIAAGVGILFSCLLESGFWQLVLGLTLFMVGTMICCSK